MRDVAGIEGADQGFGSHRAWGDGTVRNMFALRQGPVPPFLLPTVGGAYPVTSQSRSHLQQGNVSSWLACTLSLEGAPWRTLGGPNTRSAQDHIAVLAPVTTSCVASANPALCGLFSCPFCGVMGKSLTL